MKPRAEIAVQRGPQKLNSDRTADTTARERRARIHNISFYSSVFVSAAGPRRCGGARLELVSSRPVVYGG
ncbi:hypothetical protein EVAR_61497_1 [Eumeta japonica]|uniref:Uncharacterized protein n=1 Tax=Eumeta variegata TaxID=151549 RepID=A0A4C2A3Z5_EUMVA|nr:hypothetical protein EVAR_61497_1 [Eumeta japonica]